jgi:hypothetical protein
VTFQWNYVYGGLTNSVHEGGNHSHAFALAGWGYASLHHNLTAFALGRNPRISGLRVDYRNNVLHYFWDSGYGDSTDDFLKLNYLGCVLQHGDRDGMPDEWETRYGLDPHDASDANADTDDDGYTSIEEYLNGTVPTEYVDYRNPANNRDPRRWSGG